MGKISIRAAEKNDIEGIILIEQESFHENIVESRDVFLDRLRIFPQGFLVLKIKEKIAAYISSEIWEYSENIDISKLDLNHSINDVHRSNGSQLYVSSLGVLKEYHGKGYGTTLLLEFTKQITRRYKISHILLIVSVNWRAARKIYGKNGFREIQRIPGFFVEDDNSDAIVMRKHL
ncbi:MAG: N-acetyltransferase [Methanolobus sp.]|jgi:ribosomal-protein-alanine N-acetyltransferase|nr:N-acetyltransferase [Methanolobus sp.]